ncbi:MAG: PilZ domain-containing protein [Candidatus Omnitrophica bacterium]|nr:PilZ domain-containing protein [Candidatus Omnitrophota bacterium]
MSRIPTEQRSYPRLKSNLKVDISGNSPGTSVDLSESGMSINSVETISSPNISLKIDFTNDELELKTEARLVWKRDLEDGSSSYGVEFIGLNDAQKVTLRKELIKTQIKELLKEIKDNKIKEDISNFFLGDILDYTNEVNKIISHLSKGNSYSEEIEKKIAHLNNQILLKGYCLEELINNKVIINKSKEHFRSLVGTWAYKSAIVKRAFEKPRGYPGDYLMLETVYNNRTLTESGIGYYFDKYFLSNPYAVAVRYRKDKLREILRKEIQNSSLKAIKIFDIACGSCREIKELPQSLFKDKTVIFTCLDWDQEALDFSFDALKDFTKNAKFNFVKEDIMNLIKDDKLVDLFEKQDLVYSIGLIDYLPDRILKLFMQFFYGITRENGKLILTHKNKEKTFSPLPPDWFCNWKFVPRTKDEVMHLFYNCGIKDFSLSTDVDEFNDIFYFTFVKQHNVK